MLMRRHCNGKSIDRLLDSNSYHNRHRHFQSKQPLIVLPGPVARHQIFVIQLIPWSPRTGTAILLGNRKHWWFCWWSPEKPEAHRAGNQYHVQLNCWSLRCSWSIACRRCSNYIFILNLTPGFNGSCKDNYKMQREAVKFWDSACLILEILRHV